MVKKVKTDRKMKSLSLQVIPFAEIQDLSISERVKKILNLVLGNKIVILHGRLRPEEEVRLIEDTMLKCKEEDKRPNRNAMCTCEWGWCLSGGSNRFPPLGWQ